MLITNPSHGNEGNQFTKNILCLELYKMFSTIQENNYCQPFTQWGGDEILVNFKQKIC